MRVVEITKAGAPEVLVPTDRPDPVPNDRQVVVDVRASGVNFADIMGRMGLYPDAPPIPFVPGYEVAGTVDGKRVVAVTRFNGYADKALVERDQLFPLPDSISFEQAAAIPVNYLTAWVALREQARIREGDRVLVEHGAGGVGIAALQICKEAGATFVGVVSSPEKVEFLRGMGGEAVLRSGKIEGPFDVILDPTGASALKKDFRLIAPAGSIILYGASEFVQGNRKKLISTAWRYLRRPKIDPYVLPYRNAGIYGLNMLTYGKEASRKAMEKLLVGLEAGWLRPHVGATFPLEKAAEAHQYIQDRKNIGKVILTVNGKYPQKQA